MDGKAEKEIGKVNAGKHAAAAAVVELVGPVIVRPVEAQRRDGFEVLNICSKFEGVVALGPDESVAIVVGERLGEARQSVGVQALDVVEGHLRDARSGKRRERE